MSTQQQQTNEPTLTVIKTGSAAKLSPNHPGTIDYEIVQDEKQVLSMRLVKSDAGGFFSKELIGIDMIAKTIDAAPSDSPMKSALFRSLFNSGSSNNAGFLCAALRAEGVLAPAPKSLFLHIRAHPVKDWLASLSQGDAAPAKKSDRAKPGSKAATKPADSTKDDAPKSSSLFEEIKEESL